MHLLWLRSLRRNSILLNPKTYSSVFVLLDLPVLYDPLVESSVILCDLHSFSSFLSYSVSCKTFSSPALFLKIKWNNYWAHSFLEWSDSHLQLKAPSCVPNSQGTVFTLDLSSYHTCSKGTLEYIFIKNGVQVLQIQ